MPTSRRLLLLLDPDEERSFPELPDVVLHVCRDAAAAEDGVARGDHEAVLVSARVAPDVLARLRDACRDGVPLAVVGGDPTDEERRRIDDRARALVAQLTKAEEINTIGEMASSLAHELHQPLGAVVNYLNAARHILDGEAPDLDRVCQAVERSVSQARRAAEILHGIRAFVYREPPTRGEACLNELITEVCELVRAQTRLYGVELSQELDRSIPSTYINAVQFQQVVMNVISNAIEALRENLDGIRRLVVRTRLDPADGFIVTVSDTGPGFPQGELEEMFEPFFTTRAGGLGMGLAICRRFVEAHGGRLTARKNTPDAGLTFRIALPLEPGERRD